MEKRNLGGAVVCNGCYTALTDAARVVVVEDHGLYLSDSLEESRYCWECKRLELIPADLELSTEYRAMP